MGHIRGWVWWLTPVIPSLWEAKLEDPLRLEIQDQPRQHGETLSVKKKINSQAWWYACLKMGSFQNQPAKNLRESSGP